MRIAVLLLTVLFIACTNERTGQTTSLHELPTYTVTGDVNVIVEIPAGTNKKIEFNKYNGEFEQDIRNGVPRQIEFLPYPGNYGFIPSTLMDEERGGDGDALDVLVLAEGVATGDVMITIPIAMLELRDGGEIDNKIIAVPSDPDERTIYVDSFSELESDHPAVKRMLEDWFLNYKGLGEMELVGWKGQEAAFEEIENWRLAN